MFAAKSLRPTRAVIVGLGAIGHRAADECLRRDDFEIVGAVDPAHAGERIADLEITSSLSSIPDDAEVALLCTVSTLSGVEEDLATLTAAGLDVASTCEELTLPWYTNPEIAERVNSRALAAGQTILGCGVNPGLIMDVLPVMIASASLRPERVTVRRLVDLEKRRSQLKEKLGVGRTASEWNRAQQGAGSPFGHFGLIESACLLALGLGWPVESTEFSRRPLIRDEIVIGIEERAQLAVGSGRQIELCLVFALGGEDVDHIRIQGDPLLEFVAPGGVPGDKATVARLLAAARVVRAMPPGLRLSVEAPVGRSVSMQGG